VARMFLVTASVLCGLQGHIKASVGWGLCQNAGPLQICNELTGFFGFTRQ